MKILLSMKYLTFPVNTKTVSKKVCIYEGEKLLFDFDCKIDMLSPDFTAYIDVSRFMGKTVDIAVSPDMNFEVGTAEDMNLPELYNEPLRPQIHFTVKNGWNNDPNGLIKFGDVYHMFYQYNPCSNEWGNMHWGHAESTDLVHWKHCDTALFPDELGTMYSGSAICDTENLTGLGTPELPAMLFYYTAAGKRSILSADKEHTQCLAYSKDGGKTFIKYDKNPIIKHLEASNRDPKVVYVEELQKYLMIIYLSDDRYRMLTSSNLLDFEFFADISIRGDRECPDIYSLYLNGKKFWVVSGANDIYFIGHFTKNGFVIDGEEKKLSYSDKSYAAQSFSGMNDGRTIRISWNRLKIPCAGFSQQMGFPIEMSLCEVKKKYYLAAAPVREIEKLFSGGEILEGFKFIGERIFAVGANPVYITLDAEYAPNTRIGFCLFGHAFTVDTAQNLIIFRNVRMPVSIFQDKINLKIIVDRCTVEVFADGGKMYFTSDPICDYNLPVIVLTSDKEIEIEHFEYRILKSVYNELND